MAQPIYKILKYKLFEFPRLIYLRKSRSVIHALLKTESCLCRPLIWIADFFLWLHVFFIKLINYFKFSKYSIEESKTVSDEVEQIVMSDQHPFMEIHDKAWLQWCLDHSFSDSVKNMKKLYLIKKSGKMEAFFVTKQEFFEQASSRGFKNVYLGSVVEWGIAPACNLDEKDIYLLSLRCFDKNIDGIQVATSDNQIAKKLKRCLFIAIGNATMAYKLKKIKSEELSDIKNWRIRIAGGDTLLN